MHCMIDLETMGLQTDSAIVQIAAVEFEPVASGKIKRDDPFNCGVDLHRQCRHVDPDTLCWWLEQSVDARANFLLCQNKGVPLEEALLKLSSWYQTRNVQAVWSHGAAFDIALLNDAYTHCNMDPPWNYRDIRDTRTLYWHRGHEVDRMPTGTLHNALHDAVFQAEEVQHALALR